MAEALGSEGSDSACAHLGLAAAGRGFLSFPEVGVSRGVSLPFARTGFALRSQDDIQARFALLAVRSGGEQGYLGIAGEAFVPAFEAAEARWDWRATGLMVAVGLIDDPWVAASEAAWARRDVVAFLAGDQGWMDRTDAGGTLGFTAPGRVVSLALSATSGEGALRRERNTGTNLTAVVRVRPTEEEAVHVELAAMAREGSRGVGQAADHRAGGAVVVRSEPVVGGVEGLLGWGLDGDGTMRPGGFSAWARSGDSLPVVGWSRLDLATDRRRAPEAGETAIYLGFGPRLPTRDGPLYVALGWEGRQFGADATPIAGGAALTASDLFFLQIGADALASLPFGSSP